MAARAEWAISVMDGPYPLVRCRWEGVHIMRQINDGAGRGKVNADSERVIGSDILDAGLQLISGMRRTTGSGDPERGYAFGEGAATLRSAAATVTRALPGGGWLGGAAGVYAEVTRRQAAAAETMAALDRGVRTVLDREADQVGQRRERLAEQAEHLTDVSSAAAAIAEVPGVGSALRAAFELNAVNAALGTCTAELDQLTREVAENAATLQQIAGEYSALAMRTASPAADDGISTPTAEPQMTADGAPSRVSTRSAMVEPDPAAGPGVVDRDVVDPNVVDPNVVDRDVVDRVASAPSDPATAQALPTEAVSGISSAVGVAGGLVGAVTTPLVAVLSGLAAVVGQSMSTLPAAAEGASAGTTDARTPVEGVGPEVARDGVEQRPDEDNRPGERDDLAGADPREVGDQTSASAESAGRAPAPADTVDPQRPPAPTRPPQ